MRWTNGWIDRGGWTPLEFSGNYFYAQVRMDDDENEDDGDHDDEKDDDTVGIGLMAA